MSRMTLAFTSLAMLCLVSTASAFDDDDEPLPDNCGIVMFRVPIDDHVHMVQIDHERKGKKPIIMPSLKKIQRPPCAMRFRA